MEKSELKEGDLTQINPEYEKYGGMFFVVTEPKEWGAQGYLVSPHNFEATRFKGLAYLRVKFAEMEYCGKIYWTLQEKEDEEK